MIRFKSSLVLLIGMMVFFSSQAFAQKKVVDIEFDIKGYENDTMILGFYFGSKTLVLDTLLASKKGKFRYQKDTLLEPGVYLTLFKPGNTFFQFMVNEEDQKFKLQGDFNGDALKPSGSVDNKLFYDYMQLIAVKGLERDALLKEIEALKNEGKDVSGLEKKLKEMDEYVNNERDNIIKKHPKSITAMLLKSNIGVDIPEFDAEGDDLQMKRYLYYKSHYFDNIDLGNPGTLRTPFIDERVKYYLEKLTPQHPDSIFNSVQYLLGKMEPAPETFQYYTSTFLNKYANAKLIGYDAIYVKMVDHYYNNGKTPWVSEETLKKFVENAEKLRPILIGKQAPPITFYDEEGKDFKLYDLESEYTVMIFWANTCGHCKKAIPSLKEFYAKWKPRGVEILGICTKHRDELDDCYKYAKEIEIPWITVGDKYHRSKFRDVYNVVSTPRVFILDKDKEILLKRVPTEQLDAVMESLIKEIQQKRLDELNGQKQ